MVQDLYQECYEILLQLPEIYQPVLAPGLMHLKSRRLCSDRLELIINDLKDKEASINDIGCQIGFFSLSLARMGHVVHGYDMDDKNIRICKLLNELNDIPNKPTFTKGKYSVKTPLTRQSRGCFGRTC